MNTTRTALKNLNANDWFTMTDDPKATVYVCDSKYVGQAGEGTRINYHVKGQGNYPWTFVKPSLTDVYVILD